MFLLLQSAEHFRRREYHVKRYCDALILAIRIIADFSCKELQENSLNYCEMSSFIALWTGHMNS